MPSDTTEKGSRNVKFLHILFNPKDFTVRRGYHEDKELAVCSYLVFLQ